MDLMAHLEMKRLASQEKTPQSMETSADIKAGGMIHKHDPNFLPPAELDDGRKKRFKEVFQEFNFHGLKRVKTPDVSFDGDWEPKPYVDIWGNRMEHT